MMRLISLFLAISLLFSLTCLVGCHGEKNDLAPFEMPETFDEEKEYNIVFWSKNENNPRQKEVYKNAALDFEKLYPNIHVTVRYYTNYNDIYKDAITNISTNTTPNVCISYPDHIATYNTGENVIVPLDSLMSDPEYGLGGSALRFDSPSSDEMIEKFLNEGRFGGAQYAIPFMRSTEACYINEDMIKALGYEVPEILTWDFIYEVSDAATEKNEDGTYKINGQTTMIPFVYKSTDNMMIQMLAQKEAPYSSERGDVLLFNDTTKELLLDLAPHVKNGAFSTFGISSYPADLLNAGQCIFAIDSTAGATWMGPDAPLMDIAEENIVDFEIAVRPVPQFDTENPSMISQGPSICLFNKADAGEVVASWLFLQYLLTDEVQICYAMTEGYVPVTKKAQENSDYLDYLSRSGEDNDTYYSVKIDTCKLLLEYTESTFVTPVYNGSASVRQAAGQMIEETAKAARRKKTINDEFIENLYEQMTSLYRLNQITEKKELGELADMPGGSVALLVSLATAWCAIIAYCTTLLLKKRRKK